MRPAVGPSFTAAESFDLARLRAASRAITRACTRAACRRRSSNGVFAGSARKERFRTARRSLLIPIVLAVAALILGFSGLFGAWDERPWFLIALAVLFASAASALWLA